MAVESTQLSPASRDAYWQATQAQLNSARRRGDIQSLAGLSVICVMLWFLQRPGERELPWAIVAGFAALVMVVMPQWFVTRRKRQICATRGLICNHCGYEPHDTEIFEVAETRECLRCTRPLD